MRSFPPASFSRLSLLVSLLLLCSSFSFSSSLRHPLAVEDSPEAAGTNATAKEDSFANIIDRALEREFAESEQQGETDAGSFNNTVAEDQGVLETVARVTRDKPKKNDTKEEKSFQLHDVFNLDNENRADDIPTLIDSKDNVFIISKPKSKYPVLQLDLRLISDLVVVIVSATCGGIAFACAGQPVITGYLLAGSVIGPGGLSFVSEMVQVETVAQFGVIFLLFALGLEFSTTKLRVVRAVAVLGGILQIFLFMCLCGVTASLCGGKPSEGVFVGTFLSMSSTAVVLKFLMERNSVSAVHGQVTVGTLILQDCAVGLLFALLPVLGGNTGVLQGIMSMTKSVILLCTFLSILAMLCRTCVPWLFKLMISLSSETNELYQLASVAFCLLVAWCSDKLGLSLELGSFAAAVMVYQPLMLHSIHLNRWDMGIVHALPGYLRTCFMALHDVTIEIQRQVHKKHGHEVLDKLKEEWRMLTQAYLEEAKWKNTRYMPKTEEYLRNRIVSTGLPAVLVHIYLLMGFQPKNGLGDVLHQTEGLLWHSALILRMWDDFGSTMDEQERGYDASYIECHMKEFGVSEEEAREHVKQTISSAWEKLNRECLELPTNPNPFPPSFARVALNAARICPVMYQCQKDGRLLDLEGHIKMLVVDSISAHSLSL